MRIRDITGVNMGILPPGDWNAITDVPGVQVGHATIIHDGSGPVQGITRTGVTVVVPCADIVEQSVYAGYFSQNGNGECTGCHWMEEAGLLSTPIALTNTHSVGVVRDAMISYYRERKPDVVPEWMLPAVAETWDGWLSDIFGMAVRPEHVWQALDNARSGPVEEGCVGGGTGMILHEFKGGIGTSSRVTPADKGGYAVGVLVQGNYGKRGDLVIGNVPLGRYFPTSRIPGKGEQVAPERAGQAAGETGSIIVIVATNAPITADQCKRLARRATVGLARTGGVCGNGSGDIFVAFSTAHKFREESRRLYDIQTLGSDCLDELFRATAEATHEAIANALCAAVTTTGIRGRVMHALPLDETADIMRRYAELDATLRQDAL